MINTTLLVVIVRSLLSVQIKLAIKSDLMSLNALLMLTIFLLDNTINLFELAVCYSARMWTDFRVRVSGQE